MLCGLLRTYIMYLVILLALGLSQTASKKKYSTQKDPTVS